MKYFPIFLNVKNQQIAVVGGGDAAVAKLRLLLKTEGQITVYDDAPAPEIATWADAGLLTISLPPMSAEQARHACLIYAAAEDDSRDAATHHDAGRAHQQVPDLSDVGPRLRQGDDRGPRSAARHGNRARQHRT